MSKISENNRTTVRFSAEQFQVIESDAKTIGKSVPDLLKDSYFTPQLKTRTVFAKDDTLALLAALNRIGNNINQIARKLNSGVREGFNPALDGLLNEISHLRTIVTER